MPSVTDAELLSEIQRLGQLREELFASREHSFSLTPDERRVAKDFDSSKRDLYVALLTDDAALKLADTERQLTLLRAELAARHGDGGGA